MRLRMMMKRPVAFPDFDPRDILEEAHYSTTAQAWRDYGESLLLYNEPCMEESYSTSDIVSALKSKGSDITATRNSKTRFELSNGKAHLILDGSDEGTIFLRFSKEADSLDVTDFGPSDVAKFIRVLFARYDKIVSLGLPN